MKNNNIVYNITFMEKEGFDSDDVLNSLAPNRGAVVKGIADVYRALDENHRKNPDGIEIVILDHENADAADELRRMYGDRFAALVYSNDTEDRQALREMGVRDAVAGPTEATERIGRILNAMELVQKPDKRPFQKPVVLKFVDGNEFGKYMRLRYTVWDLLEYLPAERQNSDGLESDPYDRYSLQFGAFDKESGDVVAAMRFVSQEKQPQYEAIENILFNGLDQKTRALPNFARKARTPSEEHSDVTEHINTHERDGRRVGELSKLAVRVDWRGRGITKRMMEFGVAAAVELGYRISVSRCVTSQVPFYNKFGFRVIDEVGPKLDHHIQQMAYPLEMDFKNLPPPVGQNVDHMLEEFKKDGKSMLIDPDTNDKFADY